MTEIDVSARRRGRAALIGRLAGAHILCYPLMFVAAASGMSLAIVLQKEALLEAGLASEPSSWFQHWLVERVALAAGDAAVFEIIMRPTAFALGAIFVICHAASVPWALAARREALGQAAPEEVDKARKLWMFTSLGATWLVVLGGAVGWAIILLAS